MSSTFLIYGSYGFVGDAVARLAAQRGLAPILAGRNGARVEAQAAELGLAHRVFDLRDAAAIDKALADVRVVLNCAGPFLYTASPMVQASLRSGAHYLDITGEIPVFKAIASRDAEARARGVMLLPGVGFDVVPTDCLALHLKQRLPSATRLTLAFSSQGPAGPPPGTQRTSIELIPYGDLVRRDGRLEHPPVGIKSRPIDFGQGPVEATRFTWGDVFTAFYSTGIPNIEVYALLPPALRRRIASLELYRPLFKLAPLRSYFKRSIRPGPTPDKRARTFTHVWGEVADDRGQKRTSRLHGPEAGVIWTSLAALAAVQKVLAGSAPPGFQTPALAYGPDFVLDCEGVTREDLD